MQTGERQDSPLHTLPNTGVCTAKAVGRKAGRSEIQGRGVAGADKHWKRSLAREVSIYPDKRQNYRKNAVT